MNYQIDAGVCEPNTKIEDRICPICSVCGKKIFMFDDLNCPNCGSPIWDVVTTGDFIIGDDTLIRYEGDKSNVIIPDNITIIFNDAFADFNHITSVEIPYGIKLIGMWAFMRCENLKEFILPDSVEKLYDGVCYKCKGAQLKS